jgi:hypothetical protein
MRAMGWGTVLAAVPLAGCVTMQGGAQQVFSQVNTCPPDRVTAMRRLDVAPH